MAWNLVGNLKGPKGDKGDSGEDGSGGGSNYFDINMGDWNDFPNGWVLGIPASWSEDDIHSPSNNFAFVLTSEGIDSAEGMKTQIAYWINAEEPMNVVMAQRMYQSEEWQEWRTSLIPIPFSNNGKITPVFSGGSYEAVNGDHVFCVINGGDPISVTLPDSPIDNTTVTAEISFDSGIGTVEIDYFNLVTQDNKIVKLAKTNEFAEIAVFKYFKDDVDLGAGPQEAEGWTVRKMKTYIDSDPLLSL